MIGIAEEVFWWQVIKLDFFLEIELAFWIHDGLPCFKLSIYVFEVRLTSVGQCNRPMLSVDFVDE